SGATKKKRNNLPCESCRAVKKRCAVEPNTETCDRCTHEGKTCTFSFKEHGNTLSWPLIVDPPQSGPQFGNVASGTNDLDTTDYSQGSLHGGAGATGGGSVDHAMYMNYGDGSYAPMPGAGQVPPTQNISDWDLIMRMDPEYEGDGYQYRSYIEPSGSYPYQYLPPPE
ncbi:hypothetical protein B9479_006473, partial [Cryptococcus floricola]